MGSWGTTNMLLFLVIFGNIADAVSVNNTQLNLECTNDFEDLMSCYFDAENCTKHNVTLQGNDGPRWCVPQRCSSGSCCCSVHIMPILGEIHHVSVLGDREQLLQHKVIDIQESIKPKAPRNVSVKESNGNVQVLWKNSGKKSLQKSLMAQVFYREGDNQREFKPFKPSTINEHYVYEIRGRDLKPSTSYWFSVRSVSNWSRHYSDRSQEVLFTTPARADISLVSVVVALSVSAVFIIAVTYCCYVEVRSRWWDSVANYKTSELLRLKPQEKKLLKPETSVIQNLSVEPQDQTRHWPTDSEKGISDFHSLPSLSSTCTSGLSVSYPNESVDIMAKVQVALIKDLWNFNFKPPKKVPYTTRDGSYGVAAEEVSSGPVDIENKSYSIGPPNCSSHYSQTGLSDHLAATGSERFLSIPNDDRLTTSCDIMSTAQCGGNEGVTTSGHPPANSPPPPLSPSEGYQPSQTLVDGPSASLVGREVEVKHPGMSANHLLTDLENSVSVQRLFLSLTNAANSPPVVMVSGYQCVPTNPNSCV